jgi:hypothetical protein
MFTVTGPAGTDNVVVAAGRDAAASWTAVIEVVSRQDGSDCSVGSMRLRQVAKACQHDSDGVTLPVDYIVAANRHG